MKSYYKKRVISKIAPTILATGLHNLVKPFYGGIGHILMFHRIVPETKTQRIHNHLSLEITPEHLDQTINFFLDKKYIFISLDQLYNAYITGIFPKEKFLAITFDDGYKDNLEIAYPILKKYKIPFTVYITTAIPNRKAILWWYLLEELVIAKKSIQYKWDGIDYFFNTRTIDEKEQAFEMIQRFIQRFFTIERYKELFSVLFDDFHTDLYKHSSLIGMGWEEILELNNDPLVTIGAHTVNHFPLSKLPAKDLNNEILNSKIELENKLRQPIHHFSYPFGKLCHASKREYENIRSLKFKTATTSNMGNLFDQHSIRLNFLPRININYITKKRVLELQTSGLLPLIVNRGKKLFNEEKKLGY